jgi:hypothetical protein
MVNRTVARFLLQFEDVGLMEAEPQGFEKAE